MGRIYGNVGELVGRTPLVRLNRLTEGSMLRWSPNWVLQPANSVKDRIGVAIIDAAERSGELRPGGTIVEATSGNTGIALAMVGAARGYKVIPTMPETMSTERRVMLRAYGAQIVLTPGSGGHGRRGRQGPSRSSPTPLTPFRPTSSGNPANPAVHEAPPPREVWGDTDGAVDIFVAGIGTGGTVTGLAGRSKPQARGADRRVEPKDSPLLTEGRPGRTKSRESEPISFLRFSTGTSTTRSSTLNSTTPSGSHGISPRKEGILGASPGRSFGRRWNWPGAPEKAGKLIVAVVCDYGERYISTVLFDDIRE